MGGQSKGAEIDPSQQDIKAIVPPWLKNAAPMTIPQGAPGQIAALSRQLAAGGFGTPSANLKWMDQFYNPAQTMQFGAAPKPAPKPTPKTDPNMMVVKDGKLVPVTLGKNAR